VTICFAHNAAKNMVLIVAGKLLNVKLSGEVRKL